MSAFNNILKSNNLNDLNNNNKLKLSNLNSSISSNNLQHSNHSNVINELNELRETNILNNLNNTNSSNITNNRNILNNLDNTYQRIPQLKINSIETFIQHILVILDNMKNYYEQNIFLASRNNNESSGTIDQIHISPRLE